MINNFKGKYEFLSNYYSHQFQYKGLTFQNSEAAFQAQKTTDEKIKVSFQNLPPNEAKKLGRSVKLRSDWEKIKDDVMLDILEAKFFNAQLSKMLVATGSEELIEGNTWNDKYWGICNGEGQNKLGQLLMKVRQEHAYGIYTLPDDEKRAYSELYIYDVQEIVGASFDYAVKGLQIPLNEYMKRFLSFKHINLLEDGNPHYCAGMSGCELAIEICNCYDKPIYRIPYCPEVEYWIGWIISYYQWYRHTTYNEILEKFPFERLYGSFPTYHQMNEKRMFEYMDAVIYGGFYE